MIRALTTLSGGHAVRQISAKLPSIRSQIALLVLACALPSVIGLGVLVQHFYQREQFQIQRDTLATARTLAAAVGHDIDAAEGVALALASSPSLDLGELDAFAAQAAGQLRPRLPVQRLMLSDTGGRVLRQAGAAAAAPEPADNAARLAPAVALARPLIPDCAQGRAAPPEVAVDVPVLRNGQARYVLTAVLKPSRLADAAAAQRLAPDWMIALISADGIIVDRTKDPERFVGKPVSEKSRALLQGEGEGALLTQSRDGYSVFAGLSLLPGRQWAVGVGMPEHQAMADAALPSVPLIAAAVGLLLLIGIVLAWLMGGQIAAPSPA